MASFAIIRGSNRRRHEVNFEDAEIVVEITIGDRVVQGASTSALSRRLTGPGS